MKRTCESCYFSEQCRQAYPCVYYTPLDKNHEDLVIREEHEKEKKNFQKEWRVYVKRDDKD